MKRTPVQAMIRALTRRYRNSLSTAFSVRTVISEIIGVAGFVLVGCGAAVLVSAPISSGFDGNSTGSMLGATIVGLAFGTAIFFMISATAHNASDQLNPAISFALMVCGSVPLLQGCANICGQVLGGIIGSAFLRAMLPPDLAAQGLGANGIPAATTAGRAFLAEAVGMFIATYVVLEIACNPRSPIATNGFAPLTVGATFGALLIVLAPFSSGSLNPARTLGPAAITGISADLWVWIFGPIVGACVAVPFHLAMATIPSKNLHTEALTKRQASEPLTHDDEDEEDTPDTAQTDANHKDGISSVFAAKGSSDNQLRNSGEMRSSTHAAPQRGNSPVVILDHDGHREPREATRVV